MEFRMKTFKFVFLLISVGCSFAFGDKGSSENENSTNLVRESMLKNRQESDPDFKTKEKNSNSPTRQRKPDHLITPDQKLIIIEPRLQKAQFSDEGLAISHLGFSTVENTRQNIYLSDNTGKYDLKIENFQQGKPTNFQTALGAISAHILNQRNNEEYIPYPPNGDPYNHPAYRGHPHGIEPPTVRAYERATNYNYSDRRANFERENPRIFFTAGDYQTGFSDQFQNFKRSFYKDGAF